MEKLFQNRKHNYIASAIFGFILFGISGGGTHPLAYIGAIFIFAPLVHYIGLRIIYGDAPTGAIEINPDSQYKQFRIGSAVYEFEELLGYELIESAGADQSIITKGGISIGRAIVGGVAFGGLGAAVGAVTGKKQSYATSKPYVDRLFIRLTIDDPRQPHDTIEFIKKKTNTTSAKYRKALERAHKTISTLEYIAHQNHDR